MREIKFRIPHYDFKGNFVQFSYWGRLSNGVFTTPCQINKAMEKKPDEQYTGLKDKNGVEIYEWDILKVHHFHDYTGCDHYMYKSVLWNNKLGCWYFASKGKMHNTLWVLLKNSDCEIIGNIHENPELLQDTSYAD